MVELQGGFPLLIQQYRALLRKNLLLSWRNKRSTFIQLFVSFFFILLMFGIEKTINIAPKSVLDPRPLIAPPIPRCEEKHFMMSPCFDLVWSGNHSSQRIQSIVRGIMVNNPGRPIPDHKVKSFGTPEEIDDWASKNLRHSFGSLHFVERNSTVISYGIQTNSSSESWRGGHEDATIFQFQLPLQIAAEREIARSLIGDPNFRWVVGFKEFPHRGEKSFSLTGALLPTFFFAIAMFGFVFQIASLIVEKELKLRQAMTMMGLYETSYWLSWLTWETLLVLISSLLTVLFGMMFQFNFFLQNSFIILFLLFFLFQLNMIGYAFMLSNFIGKVSSATTLGFFIFIIGFITQLVTTLASLYSSEVKARYRYMWSLFPPNLLAKALQLLGDAIDPENRQHKGINWQNRAQCLDGCVITMDGIYKWLISTFVVWFLLAIYLDNIFQNSSGVRKPLFYFLNLGYWTGKDENKVKEGGICICGRSIPPMEDVTPADEDVSEEEGVVKQQVVEGVVDPNVAVQLRGLAKTYPGARNIVCCAGCCCKCTSTPTYHAVKGLWVNFAKDQLFCLLGPNGAGKTTAISCLTGIAPVTSGDAFIYGHSVRSSIGMANIRRIIGVCPQFDILWDALTGEEHLHLFASIKGLPSSLIESVTKNSLAEVRLTDAAKLRSGSYSGGMKRRLSVAIALIGDPKLVILDEPTTGMDPITRRHVWDIIENAKRGRAILLTTHSMEEADILGDRIAIMAKGKLRCIGTSVRLKSRFGAGFISNVTFHQNTPGQTQISDRDSVPSSDIYQEAVKQFFKEYLNVTPKETSKKMLTYVIPHQKEELLTNFFAELQYREREFGISDIQLGLTTLEEVFLNIAKKAELESAVAEGTMVTLTLTSGVSLEIPKGARFIGIPGTETTEHPRGLMVEVYWDQDDKGTLCISGHSSETPIPSNARTMESSASISQRGRVGRNRTVRGLVFNPDDIEGPNQ